MRSFAAFTKKEMLEYLRTYKFMILLVVFLLLGFMNPITAKLAPELVASFMPEGMGIKLAEPTIMDSWLQFFKNVPQMGLIVLIIVFGGAMSTELSKGTLIHMLTKGLPRRTVILSKFTASAVVWTGCYYMAFLVTFLYNKMFWKHGNEANLLLAVSIVWVFGLFLLSCLILGGVLFKNSFGGMLFTAAIVAVLFVVNIIPKAGKFNPVQLVSSNMSILEGTARLRDIYSALGVTAAATAALIVLGVIVFNKKQI